MTKNYKDEHHLLEIKLTPPGVTELARELQKPEHKKIRELAQREGNLEEIVGTIAAQLDIALDGFYNPEELCSMLVKALRSGKRGADLLATNSALAEVELVEIEKEIHLLPAGTDPFSLFMQEQGCEICMDKVSCKRAERCLGLPRSE